MNEERAVVSSPLIVALDCSCMENALAIAKQMDPSVVRVKVGKELFTAAGPVVLEQLGLLGFDVFLDLKFHDIPNTVAAAVEVSASLGAWMVNVHASGGPRMLEAAANAIARSRHQPLLTAVTVLTSMGAEELYSTGVQATPDEQVMRLARLAREANLDGVVCAAREAVLLRDCFGEDFVLVTPGIRPALASHDDQSRVCTPADALSRGASYLVIGRPVTGAKCPASAVSEILQGLSGLSESSG